MDYVEAMDMSGACWERAVQEKDENMRKFWNNARIGFKIKAWKSAGIDVGENYGTRCGERNRAAYEQ